MAARKDVAVRHLLLMEPRGHMNSEPEPLDRRTDEDRRSINLAGLLELVTEHNAKHDEAHRRLRRDFRELENTVVDGLKPLAERQREDGRRIDGLERTPVDVSKLMFTPRVVVAIIAVVLSIWVGFWGSTSGLRSDVRDILTRMASEQRVADANAKLLEVNNNTIKAALADNTREMKDAISAVTKKQELLSLQYNELNSQITRLSAQREK